MATIVTVTPERALRTFLSRFASVNACSFNVTAPPNAPANFTPVFPEPSLGLVVFVDASNGNDDNNGTKSQPLKTIEHALAVTRQPSASGTPRTIILRKGTYFVSSTITITPDGRWCWLPTCPRSLSQGQWHISCASWAWQIWT